MLLDPAVWTGNIFVEGKWSPAAGGTAPIIEPATGNSAGEVGKGNAEDVSRAAASAVAAQKEWAALPHTQRSAVLRKAGDLFGQHIEEVMGWLMRDLGTSGGFAGFNVHVAQEECFGAAALAGHPLGEILPSEDPVLSLARRVPAGVVGVISPFNAPLILSIRSVAPALALGNAVILKPDPRTPISGGFNIARVFEEAGLPPGVLQVIPGGADVGEAMIVEPDIRVISFTGSTDVGRRVGELGGKHLKRVHLELGGKSAMIVLDDADVDKAVNLAAWGSFLNSGQICMTTGRYIVHESLYEEFVSKLAEKASHLPVGNPTEGQVALGPIIDAGQRDKIHAIVTETVASGARVAAGGNYDSLFYQPTVLADVTPDSRAFSEEIFGPVAPVVKFSTEDEAVALAKSEYGLSLGIVTPNVMHGLALAERIPTGIVHINDQTIGDEANVPFGGVLASGNGSRFGGAAANIEAFTETRWVTVREEPAVWPF